MPPADRPASRADADVGLVLEGTYPYVQGGVSGWVHGLIRSLTELRFALVHLGPEPGAYTRRRYTLPPNVVGLTDLYCRERSVRFDERPAAQRAALRARHRHAAGTSSSHMLRGIRRLHLGSLDEPSPLEDLASGDLSVEAFLHGRASFELIEELYEALAPGASFIAFFWHLRSMHLPLVRLLSAPPPATALYHAVCTGYAGLLAAAWSVRTGRPFILTEHGIYARERKLELDRAVWLGSPPGRRRAERRPLDDVSASALRRMWLRFFEQLSRCAYGQASTIVSLCESSRARQIADGAAAERTRIIPNGIDVPAFEASRELPPARRPSSGPLRVGFVGRLVPIKDIVTFVRACAIARASVALDVRIFGPMEESPRYVRRCRRLVSALGLDGVVRFERERPAGQIYSWLDVLALTSFSEGQPLVILEAGAAGVPVVASDVGACRELLQGRGESDRRLGPSGIVTRLSAPEETAAAIVRLARDPALRRSLGAVGRQRVARFYRARTTVDGYRDLYMGGPWPESAGASSA